MHRAAHGTDLPRPPADEMRRYLAMRYLAGRWHSIVEVSFLLGFAHVTTFRKAFHRWTGCTPAQYRDGQASDGA